MFCYQCEQTAKGSGCDAFGVCGKDPQTAVLQDLLLETAKGVGVLVKRLPSGTRRPETADDFVMDALFATVTNVNFDPERLAKMIHTGGELLTLLREEVDEKDLPPQAELQPAGSLEALIGQGAQVGIQSRMTTLGEDVTGLQELLAYGLKGTAAYAHHAKVLGQTDEEALVFFHNALDFLTEPVPTVDDLLAYCLRCGEINLRVMELLDAGHTATFGHPSPTPVRIHPKKGKAILISGHDLVDLKALLEQTAGTGIDVYTHGEMLPAHGYPELRAYPHLAGNYGGAWQDQQREFNEFPGAILMTTNCIQKPHADYADRIFTCGPVAWPGIKHIADRDFAPVIAAAQAAPGFDNDGPEETILVGFGHQAVLGVADKVVEAVQAGQLRHFFLIGGCDGAKSGRNYYTELAQATPDDTLILTLACGKYRFNKLDFGTVAGLPRLLDVGQCNDAYSAIRIAQALADAFGTDVNGLPLSLVLSWYEQKAVCILLTLLHLGIKNMRLGPSLPAFITPPVLDVLVENFQIAPIANVDDDLRAMMSA